MYIQCECCVGGCYSISHCIVGSRVASDYIKSINTWEPFLRRMLPCNWLFQWGQLESSCVYLSMLMMSEAFLYHSAASTPAGLCYCKSVWIEAANLVFVSVLICGFFLSPLQAVKLSHWGLLRDSIYYTFSIIALIAVRDRTFIFKYTDHMIKCGDCRHIHTKHIRPIWECSSFLSFSINNQFAVSSSAESSR